MPQQRDHFRIVFPLGHRARLVSGLAEWEVIDLSENSAKVAVARESSLCRGSSFPAVIQFHDGATAAVTASVLRCENDEIVLQFAEPLSYSIIMAEQRRLLRLFPREILRGPAMFASR